MQSVGGGGSRSCPSIGRSPRGQIPGCSLASVLLCRMGPPPKSRHTENAPRTYRNGIGRGTDIQTSRNRAEENLKKETSSRRPRTRLPFVARMQKTDTDKREERPLLFLFSPVETRQSSSPSLHFLDFLPRQRERRAESPPPYAPLRKARRQQKRSKRFREPKGDIRHILALFNFHL